MGRFFPIILNVELPEEGIGLRSGKQSSPDKPDAGVALRIALVFQNNLGGDSLPRRRGMGISCSGLDLGDNKLR